MAKNRTGQGADPADGAGIERIEEAEVVPPPADADPVTMPPPQPESPFAEKVSDRPEPAAPPPSRRPGRALWLVLGGVVAAALGYGAAQLVPQGWPLAVVRDMARQSEAQRAEIVRLGAEVGRLAALPPPEQPDLLPLTNRLDELTGRIAAVEDRPAPPDLSSRLDALESRIAVLESLPVGTGTGADPDAVAALLREVAALRTEVAAQKTAQTAASAEVAAAAEAARAALAQTEAEAQRLRDEAAAAARGVMLRAAAARLAAAVEQGTDYAAPLQDLTEAGVTVPEVLAANAAGVPTLAALQAEFPAAARAALDAARRADMGDTTTDRLSTFLLNATGARSLTPREGGDADAILSRAEATLRDGDLAGAVAELAGLTEPARPAMQDWTARAQLRLDAAGAAAALAAGLEG